MQIKEFKKDYIYKLFTNLIRIPVSFLLQSFFPRLLGPKAYGDYEFLTDNANKFIGFFETGASIAFYTNLSKDYRNQILVKFYWILVLIISLVYVIFVIVFILLGIEKFIWPGQQPIYIGLSIFWGIMTFIANSTLKMLDACHVTVPAEQFRMFQLCFSVLIFGFFYLLFNSIDLQLFFLIQIFLIFLLIAGSYLILKKNRIALIPKIKTNKSDIKKWASVFWQFSSPLIIYSIFSLITGLGDRWILQTFGGSVQQAFFGLSLRIGTFVFLFTSAMMPLLMREFSKLHGEMDLEKIRNIFTKNTKVLYFIATVMAVLVAYNSEFITIVLGGSEYKQAVLVVTLMAFYPIHQTLGQINGILFYSTNRTKTYRNLGIIVMPIGLICSYFLIAPVSFFGLELGALGLAIQMLLIQVFSVNLMMFYNCKYLQIPPYKLFIYQLVCIVFQLILGLVLKKILTLFIVSLFMQCLIFTLVYIIFIGSFIYLLPSIIGFKERNEIIAIIMPKNHTKNTLNELNK